MGADALETELKFTISPSQGRAILAHLAPRARPARRRMTSVYYDTHEESLRRAGFSLRLRTEGGKCVQTVKSQSGAGGPISRGEWESLAPSGKPDLETIRQTPAGAILGEMGLSACFEVIVDRRSHQMSAGEAKVEVSADTGRVIANGRAARLDELELELKSGSLTDFFALAGDLRRKFDLNLSFVTKADRGFALLEARSRGARHFEPPALRREMTAGDAFRAVAQACLEQIVANGALVRSKPSADAIHQTRVAARRLRSAVDAFEPIFAADEISRVEERLRWLAGELDPARNLEVLVTGALRRATRRTGAPEGLAALAIRLRSERASAYARARFAAETAQFGDMIMDLAVWIQNGPWTAGDAPAAGARDAPIVPFAARALSRGRRKVEKRGKRFADLDRAERHRVRIAAKRLRYSAEVLAPLLPHPKRATHFIGVLKELVQVLGDLNDVATAETIVGDDAAHGLITAERRRERVLIPTAMRAWRVFRNAEPFWPAT